MPHVYVVRADGKQIYGQSGAPPALPQFLAAALKQSGVIPSRAQLLRLTRTAETVKKLVDDKQTEKAILLLNRTKFDGMFAAPAVALQKVSAELTKQGQTALAESQKKLKDEKTAFDGAMQLVYAQRVYGKLPALRKVYTIAMRDARKDATARELLQQAQYIDRAKEYEEQNKTAQAMAAWKLVAEKFPGSAAAQLAAARIKELMKPAASKSSSP